MIYGNVLFFQRLIYENRICASIFLYSRRTWGNSFVLVCEGVGEERARGGDGDFNECGSSGSGADGY